MNHEEIMTKAIEEAIAGGWTPGWQDRRPIVRWGAQYAEDYDEGEGVMISGYHAKSNASMWFFPLKELIFDHDFARALWGDTPLRAYQWHAALSRDDTEDLLESGAKENWQYHLQQMVIADDPIAYLGEWYNGFIK